MSKLTIYDSQGQPVGDPAARKNQRVADFFFDGVRLAIENVERTTVYCFFRARESEGARADQFYAEYETGSVRDVGKLTAEVERVVRDEHGMVMDNSTADATVFDLIGEASSLRAPGDTETYDAIPKLMNRGERLRFGATDYEEALGALYKIVTGGGRVNRVAIADNADSSQLSDYDVVIETGEYVGLEPIGDTENKISKAKNRGRGLGQRRGGGSGAGGGGLDSAGGGGGYDFEGGSTDDDLSILDQVKVYGVIVGFVVSVLLVIVLLTCNFAPVSIAQLQGVPVLGNQCGGPAADFGLDVQGQNQLVLTWDNASEADLTVELTGPNIPKSTDNVSVTNSSGTKTVFSARENCSCTPLFNSSGQTEWPNGTYTVSVRRGQTEVAEMRVEVNENGMSAVQSEPSAGTTSTTMQATAVSSTETTSPDSTNTSATPPPATQTETASASTDTTTTTSSDDTEQVILGDDNGEFLVEPGADDTSLLVEWEGVGFESTAATRTVRVTYDGIGGQVEPDRNPYEQSIQKSSDRFYHRFSDFRGDYEVVVEISNGTEYDEVVNTTVSFDSP